MLVFLAALTFSTALMEISFVVALVGWVFLKVKRRMVLPCGAAAFAALLAFVFLSVTSFFWSEFPRQSFRGVFKVLQHFLLFWIVAETLNSEERRQAALQVLTIAFLIVGMDGMWQHVFGFDLLRRIPFEPASSGPRVSASFKNYGLLASFLVTFWPLVAVQLHKNQDIEKSVKGSLAAVFGLLLLFWTRLRGAWISFLAGVVFSLALGRKKALLLFVGLAVLVCVLLLPKSMVIHLDSEGKEQSLVERVYLWDRAIQVIAARPWTGTGINTYSVAHQKYDKRQNWRVKNYYSHNGYLQIAAETGLPSLGCFLAFLFFYFKKGIEALQGRPSADPQRFLVGVLVGMFNFLMLGLADTVFHNPQAIMGFWFLAGWGAAYQNSVLTHPRVSFRPG